MLGTVGVTQTVQQLTETGTTGHQDTTAFNYQYGVGDIIKINGEERKVNSITNSSSMTVNVGFTNTASSIQTIQELGNILVFLIKNL